VIVASVPDPARRQGDPVDRVLDALRAHGCDPKRNGDGWSAKCPAHADKLPSLSVGEGQDGRALVRCHAGCEFAAISRALGLDESAFFPPKSTSSGPKRTTIYPYVEGGELLYEQVRDDFVDGEKKVWTRYPNGKKTRKRTLYRLDEVLHRVPPDRWVLLPEGEACVDRLVSEGFVATTNSHGAAGWKEHLARHLRGARVAILPDNDAPGAKLADQRARSLHGVAAIVKLVELHGLRERGDVVDWFSNGGTANELKRLIDGAPDWAPEKLGGDGELPDLDLNPKQAATVEDLLEKFKDLDEGDQKEGLKELLKLFGAGNQATELVKLAEAAAVDLWHDRDGTGYATLPVDDHAEHWPVRSRAVRLWLRRRYYEEHESAPNANAVRDALEVLDGKALFAGDEHEVHVRVAERDGVVYLDLCDDDWRCVQVTAAGWTVRNGAPVRFKRAKGMGALPVPEPGDVGELRPFVNVVDDEWPLALGWLVGALRPRGPYPVLDVTGEHGTAKSTLCKVLRRLVDPNKAELRAAPSETRDLAIAAGNGWVCAFDNLSSLWPKLSDDLARLSTGAGFSTRKLYEDDEEQLFDACRPVIVNGIEDVVVRPDLLDRAVILRPPRIDDDDRRAETEFWSSFEGAQPRILGALLDAVVCALTRVDDLVLDRPPRMADFARWVVAAEPALGIGEGAFLAAYRANREQAHSIALEASEVTAALLAFATRKGAWTGSAGELARLLEPDKPPKGWPRSPQGMAGALKRAAPVLRQHGVDVELEPRTSTGRRWTLTKRLGEGS
jgi:hypothetical protein